ncbi:MAG: glycosyltransferase family 4 protein [Bacteroidetes bacterium]|nr:glycosyltransferase family 4 protein [Bacteroidota bacterium]
MAKKKVLILGKLPPPYMGPAIATEILLKSSLRESFELIHLNTKVNEKLSGIGRWSLKKIFRSYSLYWQMIRIVATRKPDLILIPFSQDTIPFIKDSLYILIAKIFRRKVLLHLRGSNFLGWLGKSSPLTKWYVKKMIVLCNGVIVLGHNLKYLFQDYFSEDKIFVVPNGADFSFPSRTDAGLKILYFANLFRAKGIEDVLLAVKIVCDKGLRDFSLEVVGDWLEHDTEKQSRSMVSEYKLPVNFNPPASGERKFAFFANADIFIFAPREPEGHPWVIVEAMAAGLPIIATNKGAIVESVRHGENGFIVKDRSPEEIAARLMELLADKELRTKLGKKSRDLYEDGFTENKMASRLGNAFNKVMEA